MSMYIPLFNEAAIDYEKERSKFVGRDWGDPAESYCVIGLDFGKNKFFAYDCMQQRSVTFYPHEMKTFLQMQKPETLIAVEDAHFGKHRPEKILTKAQVFSELELKELHSIAVERNLWIWLMPQSQIGRMRKAFYKLYPQRMIDAEMWDEAKNEYKKSDTNDAKFLAWYVSDLNGVSPRKIKDITDIGKQSEFIEECNTFGKTSNGYILALQHHSAGRSLSGLEYFIEHVEVVGFVKSELDTCAFAEEMKFGAAEAWVDGLLTLMFRGRTFCSPLEGGKITFNKWWRYVARQTPFHWNGGAARALFMGRNQWEMPLGPAERRRLIKKIFHFVKDLPVFTED